MTVFIDEPRTTDFKNYSLTAHLLSDNGRDELMEFGCDLGMKKKWLHNPGTPKEHFDLFDAWIGFVIMKGAKRISRKQFIEIIREKRRMSDG
jgi:hypothetical protein